MFFHVFLNYVVPKVTARGPEIFFFIFLIFSAVLQQKIPIICTHIDNNYMFDIPGHQPPAPPRNTQTEATSLCA